MTIAEQIAIAKADLDAVYAAGQAAGSSGGTDLLRYISDTANLTYLFYKAKFAKEDLLFAVDKAPSTLHSVFRLATGYKRLTVSVPRTKAYVGDYFIFGSATDASNVSTIEELTLPDGIKFSSFVHFAGNCVNLQTINGSIDLSESTNNDMCFMSCTKLVDVKFADGSIQKSLYIKQSDNLSDASITSIVNGLATVGTRQTLTVHVNVAGRMSEAQKATITAKNWELVS
jgi:hypothetical protein